MTTHTSESQDVNKRLTYLEAAQENIKNTQHSLKANQESTARDLRQTSESLRILTNDIGILVNNVSHLTDAISNLHKIIDRTHKIEIDLVEMKSRTDSLNRLWQSHEEMKTKVEGNNILGSGIKIALTAVLVATITILVTKLF